ncbi:MAG TPA: hypothetical protein DEB40_08015 [Elusimicrobia bacterium]|nr:hypothetical protein [Elusimicrobiota bacterium]HBT61674.1 hypothetical protein [Elusimicrobiota bacterium]
MRFYFFDGKAPQGPFEIEELLRQPGFEGESVVCPVGSERAEDWKAAVNFELLRDALFKPKPALLTPPPPILFPCPNCRHRNSEDALFCNHCGRSLRDSPAEPPRPKESAIPPAPADPGPTAPPPETENAKASRMAMPLEPAPAPLPPVPAMKPVPKAPDISAGPRRAPAPGGMGRIAQFQQMQQEQIHSMPPAPAISPPTPALPEKPFISAPENPPAPKARKAASLALLLGGLFAALAGAYVLLGPSARQAATISPQPLPEVKPQPQPAVAPAPAAAQAQNQTAPAEAPALPKELAPDASGDVQTAVPVRKAARPRRRKSRTPAASARLAQAEPPQIPASSDSAAAEVLLPGLKKRVRRAPARYEAVSAAQDKPSAPTPDELMAQSAKDQFNFCHQIMAQGAFGSFFDTCLCAAAKSAPPYKGRRRAFIELASESGKEIGSTFAITGAQAQGSLVRITAQWTKPGESGERSEDWLLEDGRWCLSR